MQIVIRRLKANHLYTEGVLMVNDQKTIPYSLEHTFTMLPIGEYKVRLIYDKKRHRVIGILPKTGTKPLGLLQIGTSYLSINPATSILVGEQLIPGSTQKGKEHYNRLYDRIEKCEARKEPISLIITDAHCQESKVCSHWLR